MGLRQAVELGAGWAYVETTGEGEHTPIGDCVNHTHDTEDEARACYASVLHAQIQPTGQRSALVGLSTHDQCRVCGQPTAMFAWLLTQVDQVPLCDVHLTAEIAAALLVGAHAGNTTHA